MDSSGHTVSRCAIHEKTLDRIEENIVEIRNGMILLQLAVEKLKVKSGFFGGIIGAALTLIASFFIERYAGR
jgi:hypothetical protein